MTPEEWSDPEGRCVGLRIAADGNGDPESGAPDSWNILFLLFNASTKPILFQIPPLAPGSWWELLLDTARPERRAADGAAPPAPLRVEAHGYEMLGPSVAILRRAGPSAEEP
jgi:hypothetical protein